MSTPLLSENNCENAEYLSLLKTGNSSILIVSCFEFGAMQPGPLIPSGYVNHPRGCFARRLLLHIKIRKGPHRLACKCCGKEV